MNQNNNNHNYLIEYGILFLLKKNPLRQPFNKGGVDCGESHTLRSKIVLLKGLVEK
jgi:hypothetical protein